MKAVTSLAGRVTHVSSWPDAAGHTAFLAAYQRVLDELWPAPYQSVLVPTRFGTSHVLISGPPVAPPLLALPGAGLSATSWYPNVSALAGRFRVYAADLIFDRGRGNQTTPVRGARVCAAWAAELLDAVGVDRCSVVGLSQGGWVAASLASRHPSRVDRLALLAPAGALRRFRAPFWLLFRGAQDLLPRGDPRKRAARVFSMVGLQPPEPYFDQVALGSQHFREQRPPAFPTVLPDEALRALTMPVLLLLAGREVLYDASKAEARARALIPDLQADVVPDVGHFIAMAAPGPVNERLLSFLDPPARS